jgi:hypothetical protein
MTRAFNYCGDTHWLSPVRQRCSGWIGWHNSAYLVHAIAQLCAIKSLDTGRLGSTKPHRARQAAITLFGVTPRSAVAGSRRFLIDRSDIGHSLGGVAVSETKLTINVAASLHPSFGTANQSRRMKNMLVRMTVSEIVAQALAGCSAQY